MQKRTKNHVKNIRDFLLDAIFPIECLGCNEEGSWLCKKCFQKLEIQTEQYCLNCKTKNYFGNFCSKCKNDFYLDGVLIACNYENELIAKLIKTMKYRFADEISIVLGNLLSFFLKNKLTQINFNLADLNSPNNNLKLKKIITAPKFLTDLENTIIIPVPLHKKRENWRGFNQSEKIAQVISKNFNLKINSDLVRIKHKQPQAKLNSTQRKENIIDCFAWTGKNLSDKNILLIDDVTTTGSTLNECAKVLKQNKAREVWGLVIANG